MTCRHRRRRKNLPWSGKQRFQSTSCMALRLCRAGARAGRSTASARPFMVHQNDEDLWGAKPSDRAIGAGGQGALALSWERRLERTSAHRPYRRAAFVLVSDQVVRSRGEISARSRASVRRVASIRSFAATHSRAGPHGRRGPQLERVELSCPALRVLECR